MGSNYRLATRNYGSKALDVAKYCNNIYNFSEHGVSLSKWKVVSTNNAKAMVGARIKIVDIKNQVALEVVSNIYIMHREALVAKKLVK